MFLFNHCLYLHKTNSKIRDLLNPFKNPSGFAGNAGITPVFGVRKRYARTPVSFTIAGFASFILGLGIPHFQPLLFWSRGSLFSAALLSRNVVKRPRFWSWGSPSQAIKRYRF